MAINWQLVIIGGLLFQGWEGAVPQQGSYTLRSLALHLDNTLLGKRRTAVLERVTVLGSPDAPTTILEFTDLLCQQCRRFDVETFGTLREKLVTRGVVSFIPVDFVMSAYAEAQQLFALEFCSIESKNFWDIRSLILRLNNPLQVEELRGQVSGLHNRNASCNAFKDARSALVQRLRASTNFNVTATPTFVIGHLKVDGFHGIKSMSGFMTYAQMKQFIDEVDSKAGIGIRADVSSFANEVR